MPVFFHPEQKTFHLQGKSFSYCLHVGPDGVLYNLHWGKRLPDADLAFLMDSFWPSASFDLLSGYRPTELPGRGVGCYGTPALCALNADGNDVTALTYESHTVSRGKEPIPGLPATYVESDEEATSLTIRLRDNLTGLAADVTYTVFEQLNALARRMTLVNEGENALTLTHMQSASVPLYGMDYDLVHLRGAWARERQVVREAVGQARTRVESQRGASGHEENPFVALCEKSATAAPCGR